MRLFVSVDLPEHVAEDLDDFLDVRRDAGTDLRWSATHQWHVTLAFMGAAPERVVEDLVEAVVAAAARTAPVSLVVAGGGCFPDVARARVLYAGLAGGEALGPLARSVRSACSVVGAAPEGGPFHPHVTLARLPRPVDASRWVRVLDGYRGPSRTSRSSRRTCPVSAATGRITRCSRASASMGEVPSGRALAHLDWRRHPADRVPGPRSSAG